MTRIVAGAAGGVRLKVPPTGTRPTADRVREALFSSLQARLDLDGARVLDLFAGSGALGLEALSRGASRLVLVDSAARAGRVMAANVAAVGLPGAEVRVQSAAAFLRAPAEAFDLVLLDPPYDLATGAVEALLADLTAGWLAEGALVVVERGRGGEDLQWPAGFADAWQRRIGDTVLLRAVWYGHDQVPGVDT